MDSRRKIKIMLTSFPNCDKYRPKMNLRRAQNSLKEVMRGKKSPYYREVRSPEWLESLLVAGEGEQEKVPRFNAEEGER
jgi:hypothetical protein